jgi:hypothetical protein
VRLDGRLGEHQLVGDLGVGEPAGDGDQDLALARRDVVEPGVGGRSRAAGIGQLMDDAGQQAPGRARRDDRVAAGDRADRRHQVGRLGVLEQEAAGARAQRGVGVLVEVEGRQDDHARAPAAFDEPARGLHAVHPGHAHVHQDDVGLQALDDLEGLVAVTGLADELEVGLGLEDHPEAHAQQLLVVDEHDRGAGHAGVAAVVAGPGPALGLGRPAKVRVVAVRQPSPPGSGPEAIVPS